MTHCRMAHSNEYHSNILCFNHDHHHHHHQNHHHYSIYLLFIKSFSITTRFLFICWFLFNLIPLVEPSSSSSSDIISIFHYPTDANNNDDPNGRQLYGTEAYLSDNENIEDLSSYSLSTIHQTNLCDKYGGIQALGMESEKIPDSALSASSAFEMLHVGPQNARLNKDKAGGAWCPSKQLGPDTSGNEWIQVDLGSLHVVTGVATQGRYGKGLGQEFTECYNILYSRQIIPTKWIKWKSLDGFSNLNGNIDPNTVEEHHLDVPIVGIRHIRLLPISNHTRTVCLRFELYGCLYQGPISYTLPAAAVSSTSTSSNLLDLTYDGLLSESGIWYGGLGQLTDGIKPLSLDYYQNNNIKIDENLKEKEEYLWVGWRNKEISNSNDRITAQIAFEFDQVYNFTSLSLNCRNDFQRNIKAFNSALIWFSLDYQQWSHSAITFEYQTDNVIETPRDITIPLQYRIGQFIRIELKFQSEWLQLSEITFQCNPLPMNMTMDQKSKLFEWTHSAAYNAAVSVSGNVNGATGTRFMSTEDINNLNHHNKNHSLILNYNGKNDKYDHEQQQTIKYSLIIACICTLGLVILSLLTSFILKRLNLRKNNIFTEISNNANQGDLYMEPGQNIINHSNTNSNMIMMLNNNLNLKNIPNGDSCCGVDADSVGSPLYYNPSQQEENDEAEYAIIPDVICSNNLSKTLHNNHNSNDKNNNNNKQTTKSTTVAACKTLQINPRFYASSDILINSPPSRQNIYGTRLGSTMIPHPHHHQQYLPPHPHYPHPIRNLLNLGNLRNQPINQQQQQLQTPILDPPLFSHLKTFPGSMIDCDSSGGDLINGTFGVRIYSESEIGVLQTLGKSKYGDVLLCNIPSPSNNTNNNNINNNNKNRLAVVRTVNDLELKSEFIKSMDYWNKLSLSNGQESSFTRLLGIIDTPTYFASILEHGDCDLNYFLRKSNPEVVSSEVLLYLASQLANGFTYLESIQHPHEDIATRNVIIYEKNLLVKISDGAEFMNKYSMDYYNGLPIRWMSPESIVQNEFTIESDVYAFGVCFWEILIYCKCRPFQELTDEEIIATMYSYMNHNTDDADKDNSDSDVKTIKLLRLPRPSKCSKEIYELIQECLDPDQNRRPTFQEIALFLQRKTLAFHHPHQQQHHRFTTNNKKKMIPSSNTPTISTTTTPITTTASAAITTTTNGHAC